MSRKPYIREVPKTTWWLSQRRYLRYMAREVTCIFIGVYTVVLLVGIRRLAEGPASYEAFLEGMNTPLSILFHIVAFAFTVYHATSWFNVTPAAMPIQRGEEMVPGRVIIGAHYAGWAVVSLVVLFMAGM